MTNEAPCILFPEPRDRYLDSIKQSRIDTYTGAVVGSTITGDESMKLFTCRRVSMCSYHVAKMKALEAPHLVLGSKYSMIDAMYTHHFEHRAFVCFDEAHTLEEDLLSLIELTLKKSILDDMKITPNKENWVETFDEIIGKELEVIAGAVASTKSKFSVADDVRKVREYLGVINHVKDIKKIYDAATWICTEENRKRGITYSFRPVWVTSYAQKILPMIGDKRLFMSATLDANLLIDTLGLDTAKTLWLNVEDSLFPAKNRPVYCTMSGDLARRSMSTDLPKVLAELQRICDAYPDDRILVLPFTHALKEEIDKHLRCPQKADVEKYRDKLNRWCQNTYDGSTVMQQHLSDVLGNLKYDRRIFASDQYRFAELDLHIYETVPSSVLLSTYLVSGYDGRDDRCRILIVPKIPYGDLGDEVTKKRMEQNPRWYQLQTIQTLVQMLGRAVRSETDHAKMFVLDKQMSNLYRRSANLFPRYIREALLWKRNV
jgi:Rad3-related DNA helicase